MVKRTNDEWLRDLQHGGARQTRALSDLREYLRRAAFVYLRDQRPELRGKALADLHEMAEDYAQEALLSIRSRLETFRGDARFTTWAYRFVVNEAASDLRRRRYRNLSLDQLAESESTILSTLLETDTQLDPELASERRDAVSLVLNIIRNELNERQRYAILAVHFEGLSMEEVADLLEITPNTLYKVLHDARKKIKGKLLARHMGAGDILALFDSLW